jgi:hypothetical protein
MLQGNMGSYGARLGRVNIMPPAIPLPSLPPDPILPNPAPAPQLVPVQQLPLPTTIAQIKANCLTAHARAYDLPSIPALIAYLHTIAGVPVQSTWLAAIKRGAYISWPGLIYTSLAQYCPEADESDTLDRLFFPQESILECRTEGNRIILFLILLICS